MDQEPVVPRPEKIAAGRYKYRGRYIIRTMWEGTGPRGGTRYLWEFGDEDKYHGVVLSSADFFPTLRDAIKQLDKEAEDATH